MKNFIPTIICLMALFFVAVKDTTYNVAPPYSWYDVVGCLAVVFFIASFIWGMVQQSNDNNLKRSDDLRKRILTRPGGGYRPTTTIETPPPHKPLNPPKQK